MLSRLGYLALLVLCVGLIWIGLWPSPLTLISLVALPTAVVALIGAISPETIRSRPRLRRILRGSVKLLLAASAFVLVWYFWNERRPVVLVVTDPYPEVVRVIYEVTDGSRRRFRWDRVYQVPANGIVHTGYSQDHGHYRMDNPHPTKVVMITATDESRELPGGWLRGGFARGTACYLSYDEYLVGREVPDTNFSRDQDSWLDSLAWWGVSCMDGRLSVDSTRSTDLGRPTERCHYDRDGSMSCTMSNRLPLPSEDGKE